VFPLYRKRLSSLAIQPLSKVTKFSIDYHRLTMSQPDAPQTTFASGRYSKRKRTQINYRMEELDFADSDSELEEEVARAKVRRLYLVRASNTDLTSEATQDCSIEASSKAHDLPVPSASS
jgi:hypothetical protein